MPGCAVHLLLANRVLAGWRGGRCEAPFPIADDGCRDAFHAGCIGPDIGYYPGCDHLLAELAHYLKPVDLVRAMIRQAPAGAGRAFAWGWATHVLADAWIHPLVNRGVGRKLGRGGPAGLSYAEDPIHHVRVELGLDAWYARNVDVPGRLGPSPFCGPDATGFIADAYDETYRIRVDRRRLLASFRNATRLLPWMLRYERIIAPAMSRVATTVGARTRADMAVMAFRAASRLVPGGSAARGLLRPDPPPDRLIEEVEPVLDGFADRFLVHYQTGLADLPQYNLDTGIDEGESPEYLLSRASLRTLERLRGERRP